MRILKQATEAVAEWKNFRVTEAIKPANYSCQWGAREDGMLCIGIARHGYGAWVPIRDDPDLGLGDKFFLEEHRVDKKEERSKGEEKNAKSPGAVHLVRRANYLLTILKDKEISDPNVKRLIENHHRNNKKHHLNAGRRIEKGSSVSASPAPSGQARKVGSRESDRPTHRALSNSESRHSESRPESRQHDKDRPRHSDQYRPSDGHRKDRHRDDRGSIDRRSHPDRTSTPEMRRKISADNERTRPKEDRPRANEERPRQKEERRPQQERQASHVQSPRQSHHNHNRSVDLTPKKTDEFVERKMRPVRDNLGRLKKATNKNYPVKENLIRTLKTELIAIGNFIRAETREQPDLEERLW